MTPPSDSPAPAPERRLAVLLSHFHPPSSAERLGTAVAAEAEAEAGAGLSASPCAAGDSEEGEGKPSGAGRCVFCNIVAGDLPAFKLYEDDVCLCILDAKPLTAGHSLIIPKSHYPSMQTTPPTVLAAICSKLPFLSTAIMKATQCGRMSFYEANEKSFTDSVVSWRLLVLPTLYKHIALSLYADAFNVLINNGEKAGQVIFHTHIHIIPRSKDDNLWSSETYSRKPLTHDQETKNLVDSIKEILSSSAKDYSTVTPSTPKEL
ncbi:hypothetical protein EJB05_02931, partial [Eragrostis curvula]